MYSCYSFANNQYKRSMDLHNERNHGISACPSLRKITADLSWSFLYGGAMRYLKGGRLFEYVRLECVFYADFESVLGCFPHETQLPTMRNMLREKKLPCTVATHCNQAIQVLNGIARWTQSYDLCSRIPAQQHCRPGCLAASSLSSITFLIQGIQGMWTRMNRMNISPRSGTCSVMRHDQYLHRLCHNWNARR